MGGDPFRRFVHDHHFETADNGARMSAVVEFAAYPVVDGRLLAPYLRRFLVQRNESIRRLAEEPR